MNLNDNYNLPSNKKFGFFFSFVFFLFFAITFYYGPNFLAVTFFGLFVSFLAIATFIPKVLLPLNKLWMKFGFLLGMIVSPIILGIIFFFLFTPISLIMKILRDELLLKKDNDKISYWKMRDPSGLEPKSFEDQF